MVKVYIAELNCEGFPNGLFVDQTNDSLFFCLGYAIVKLIVRARLLKLGEQYLQSSLYLLDGCGREYPDQNSFLNGLVRVVEWVNSYEDLQAVFGYIENFENFDYLQQVICSGKCVFYYLLKDEDPAGVLATQPSKVFEKFCEFFKCYVNVWWDGGSYLYKGYGLQCIINLYYGNNQFVWMIGANHTNLERNQNTNTVKAHEEFLFDDSASRKTELLSILPISGHPKLIEFVQAMSETILKHQIYSKKLQTSIESVINANKNFSQFEEFLKIQGIQPPFCQIHNSSDLIPLFCKKEHCKFCVFEKIKKEFRKDNFRLFCWCNIQIPPKLIKEIKEREDYKEFSKGFSVNL